MEDPDSHAERFWHAGMGTRGHLHSKLNSKFGLHAVGCSNSQGRERSLQPERTSPKTLEPESLPLRWCISDIFNTPSVFPEAFKLVTWAWIGSYQLPPMTDLSSHIGVAQKLLRWGGDTTILNKEKPEILTWLGKMPIVHSTNMIHSHKYKHHPWRCLTRPSNSCIM